MKILIEELYFETIIGILPDERLVPQRVRIDCSIDYHYREERFINYADVAAHIQQTMCHRQFELIEEALEALSISLKKDFPPIESLSLTIRKPDILSNCTVGVQKNFIF